jgi:hypothetical protein
MTGAITDQQGRHLLRDGPLPADRASAVKLTGGLSAVRTVSATDKQHLCEAVFDAHASYVGAALSPPPLPAHDPELFYAKIEVALESADFSDAEIAAVHRNGFYQDPAVLLRTEGYADTLRHVIQQGIPGLRGTEWKNRNPEAAAALAAMEAADLEYNAAKKAHDAAERVFKAATEDALVVDRHLSQLNGGIAYKVEATDDGQAYITVLGPVN